MNRKYTKLLSSGCLLGIGANWLLMFFTALASAQVAYLPVFHGNETVLFQGDSITDMARGRTEDPNHILGHSYVFLIASRYGAAYPEQNIKFLNRGCSGDTVQSLADRWDRDTVALKPDVVSILVGINDVLAVRNQGKPLPTEAIFETYDELLAQISHANPQVKLMLCEPFILDVGRVKEDPTYWHESVGKLQSLVARLAAKYKAPVAHFQRVLDNALQRAPADYWIWDGVHPTYAGQQLLADEWIRTYTRTYFPALWDPTRNAAIAPEVNLERDSYNWTHRHADVLAAQSATQPEIVMIGDSITHFWGGIPRATQVHGGNSWDKVFGQLRVLNMGFGWDRTQNVLWRLAHGEFDGIKPKSIVLNIGTNNLADVGVTPPNTPEETAAGIEAIVSVLRQRAPDSRIFVMGVFPRGFDKGNPLDRKISELNKILSRSLKNVPQVTFLDIGARLREPDGSISPRNFSDGTHLTEAGYTIWGQALREYGAIFKPK